MSGVFGTIPEVERVGIYDFFNFLSYSRIQEQKLKEQYEKQAKTKKR